MKRHFAFYFAFISSFAALLYIILGKGKLFELSRNNGKFLENPAPADSGIADQFFTELMHNLHHPMAILILQIISIIIVARFFAFLFNKIRQPSVIGEIVAGIVLGPSFLGYFFPEFSLFLFPAASLVNLHFLSHIGLLLFMFIIGMELDMKVLKTRANTALIISHTGIVVPYISGVILSYFLYESFAPATVSFRSFALFMGIAMSITAFPVLARIIQEKGMTKTPLGSLAITSAAFDDLSAWCVLAIVVAFAKAGTVSTALVFTVLTLAYVLFMFFATAPFLNRIGSIYVSKENLDKTVMAFVFLILLGSAWMTEVVGIQALFGAFLAGVIMPQNLQFKKLIEDKIEDVSIVLLLPLFFVITGLRTEIGLLNEPRLWLIALAILGVAVLGKFGGVTIAARFTGQTWKDSFALGALMNTRGLMELIVLNIGYDLGILSPEIFAMMVLMAIVTTFMTGPLLGLIEYLSKERIVKPRKQQAIEAKKWKILVSFGQPKMGATLFKLVNGLFQNEKDDCSITALHLTPSREINPYDALIYEKEAFTPAKKIAGELDIKFDSKYKATEDVSGEILRTAESGKFNLLVMGAAKSPFSEDIMAGKIKSIVSNSNCNVLVLSDKNFEKASNILVLTKPGDDKLIPEIAGKFIFNSHSKITLWDYNLNEEAKTGLLSKEWEQLPKENIITGKSGVPVKATFAGFDLVIISKKLWRKNIDANMKWLPFSPSVLILKGKQ